jgi:hypothetical protein
MARVKCCPHVSHFHTSFISVRLLRHGLFNEPTDVREASVRSAA